MKPLRIPLRVVFYQDDDADWLAHCLELDLIGDGPTKDEALQQLGEAIAAQLEACLKYGSPPENFFTPADPKFHMMFAAGRDVATAELKIQVESITIDDISAREYADEHADSDSDLTFA